MDYNELLKPVELKWDKKVPLSGQHNDFYFSLKNGLAETRYVFLEANNIAELFVPANANTLSLFQPPITIVETGFGTGLNFLATWQLWASLKKPKRPLHFISIEKYPLSKPDLQKCLDLWPILSEFKDQLICYYPDLIAGQHQLSFENGSVKLTLLLGEATEMLKQHQLKADCWYLDGFSPSKNPSMWCDALFKQIALHSHKETTFSTFTAASSVNKGLRKAGFNVRKQKGFGAKREMLFGKFNADVSTESQHFAAWSLPCKKSSYIQKGANNNNFDALVIGAGIAGLTTALTLAEQGLSVLIIDEQTEPVAGASGQSQLAMYAKLPSEKNKITDFTTHCLSFSQRYYQQQQDQLKHASFWHQSGLLQLSWCDKEKEKQQRLLKNIQFPSDFITAVSAEEASELSGLSLNQSALWFPKCGWLAPKPFASEVLKHPGIQCIMNTHISQIIWQETNLKWQALSASQNFTASNIIVANANQAKKFEQLKHLPSKPLRGQVSSIKHTTLKSSKTILCGEGYLCPSVDGWHHFGATFDLTSDEPSILASDQLKNIQNIQHWLPNWLSDLQVTESRGLNQITDNAGLRCTTPDYIPIVGQAPDFSAMVNQFAKLRVGANSCKNLTGHYLPHLYVNIGHGSKGLFTTPVAAELIRSHICGGAFPFSEQQRVMLSPARFIIKHLKQRKI